MIHVTVTALKTLLVHVCNEGKTYEKPRTQQGKGSNYNVVKCIYGLTNTTGKSTKINPDTTF